MERIIILMVLLISSISFVSAQIVIEGPELRTNQTINLITPEEILFSNATFNQSLGDDLYWRLDATNDPPTDDWNMGGFGFTNQGNTTFTEDNYTFTDGNITFQGERGALIFSNTNPTLSSTLFQSAGTFMINSAIIRLSGGTLTLGTGSAGSVGLTYDTSGTDGDFAFSGTNGFFQTGSLGLTNGINFPIWYYTFSNLARNKTTDVSANVVDTPNSLTINSQTYINQTDTEISNLNVTGEQEIDGDLRVDGQFNTTGNGLVKGELTVKNEFLPFRNNFQVGGRRTTDGYLTMETATCSGTACYKAINTGSLRTMNVLSSGMTLGCLWTVTARVDGTGKTSLNITKSSANFNDHVELPKGEINITANETLSIFADERSGACSVTFGAVLGFEYDAII